MASCPNSSRRNCSSSIVGGILRSLRAEPGNVAPQKKQKASSTGREVKKQSPTLTTKIIEPPSNSNIDWRDKYESIRDIHSQALEKKHLADVNFIVGEEKVVFGAHRMILALGSPVFEAMFFGGLAEKGDSVSIPDVDPKGFEYLLRFLYNGELVLENENVAFKTYFAADKYCVVSLRNRCESYLIKCDLKPSNIWLFLESCLLLNSNPIINRSISYLSSSTKKALEHNSFLDVTPKSLEAFLSIDAINVTEIKLVHHLIRWTEHKCQFDPDPVAAFRTSLAPMLKLIRFNNMSHQDFVTFLETPKVKGFLGDSDALAILKYIIKPSACSPPEWCCKKARYINVISECTSGNCKRYERRENLCKKQREREREMGIINCCKRKWEGSGELRVYTMPFSSSDSEPEIDFLTLAPIPK